MRDRSSPDSTRSKSRRWIVLVLMVLPLAFAATPGSAHTVSISHTPPAAAQEGQDLPLTITVNGDCERGGASGQQSSPEEDWYDSYTGRKTIARVGAKTECSAMNLHLSWWSSFPDGSSSSEVRYQSVQMGPADALGARTATLTIPASDVVGSRLNYSVSVFQTATGPCARVYEDKYPGILCQVAGFTIKRPPVGAAAEACTSTASASRFFSVSIEGAPEPSPSPSPTRGQGKGKK